MCKVMQLNFQPLNQVVTVSTWVGLFSLLSNLPSSVHAKGVAARGVAAGGGGVCSDCTGVDTDEEIQAAFIVVSIICILSMLICSCQCYQKFAWEVLKGNRTKRPMPMAPYDRDLSSV